MSLVVNTNVGSLNAQRSLASSGAELKTAMERLSSGKKINSAADDAAGFAIAERMTAQIRGLNMATKNANDGLSMLAVIENATNDVTDMLQRMRELAIQAANDTNGSVDRAFLQEEVNQLVQEIDRVATQTQYNGQVLLDGSFQNKSIQVGTEAGQTIEFSIESTRKGDIGDIQYSRNYEGDATNVIYDPQTGTSKVTLDSTSTSFQAGGPGLAIGGNGDFEVIDVEVKAAGFSADGTESWWNGTRAQYTSADGTEIWADDVWYTQYDSSTDTTLIANSHHHPYTNWANEGDTLRIGDSFYEVAHVDQNTNNGGRGVYVSGDASQWGLGEQIFVVSKDETIITVEGNATELHGGGLNSGTTVESAHGHHRSIDSIDLVHNASQALSTITAAIEKVSGQRATLGALQNRLEYTVSNLMNVAEFTTSARSRIEDADFAAESARLAKAQVLQQTGTAMLAQANAQPQLALSLIR